MTQDDAKQLAYSLDRQEHTAKCMVETNPQIAFKTDLTGATATKEEKAYPSKAADRIGHRSEDIDEGEIERRSVSAFNGS